MKHLDSLMLPGVPAGFFSRLVAQPAPTTGAEYSELQTAMIDALTTAPNTIVPTPGWRDSAKTAPASEVLADMFAGQGDTLQNMLIGLLPHLVKSTDPVIRLQAMAIVSTAAAQYAAFHEADLRAQRAEADDEVVS